MLFLDPGSGMGKNQDPGSGINIPDLQYCFSGQKTGFYSQLKHGQEICVSSLSGSVVEP